MFGLRDRDLL